MPLGGMAERLKAPALKAGEGLRLPGVRIPVPPFYKPCPLEQQVLICKPNLSNRACNPETLIKPPVIYPQKNNSPNAGFDCKSIFPPVGFLLSSSPEDADSCCADAPSG